MLEDISQYFNWSKYLLDKASLSRIRLQRLSVSVVLKGLCSRIIYGAICFAELRSREESSGVASDSPVREGQIFQENYYGAPCLWRCRLVWSLWNLKELFGLNTASPAVQKCVRYSQHTLTSCWLGTCRLQALCFSFVPVFNTFLILILIQCIGMLDTIAASYP